MFVMPNIATWEKDGKQLDGVWWYHRSSDTFHVDLDSYDPITGFRRKFDLKGYDVPEFNGWKLVEKRKDS